MPALAVVMAAVGSLVPATPSSAAVPDCGGAIYKSNGTRWQCTFADNFDGTSLDRTKWSPVTTNNTGLPGGPLQCLADNPNNISVQEGQLHLTVRRETIPVVCSTWGIPTHTTPYTAAGVYTDDGRTTNPDTGLFTQTYGRFETRAAFPPSMAKGVHSAIWMWSTESGKKDDNYGANEIDTAEFRTGWQPDTWGRRSVDPYLHFVPEENWKNADGATVHESGGLQGVGEHCWVANPERWHTYAVEWNKETITFIYDGRPCLTVDWQPAAPLTKPSPFDEPFFITLTNWLSLEPGNEFVEGLTDLPSTMKIDYVKAWS